jgi:putative ABC transport system ATP-binding protein
MNEATIEARGVVKSYRGPAGRVEVLRGISLRIESGRMVCIIGPSGSGKTTLLGCLAGLLLPDSGEVYFRGQRFPCSESARARLRRQHMAFVFQTGNLLPYLTASQNAALSLILKGVKTSWGSSNRRLEPRRGCWLSGHIVSAPTSEAALQGYGYTSRQARDKT